MDKEKKDAATNNPYTSFIDSNPVLAEKIETMPPAPEKKGEDTSVIPENLNAIKGIVESFAEERGVEEDERAKMTLVSILNSENEVKTGMSFSLNEKMLVEDYLILSKLLHPLAKKVPGWFIDVILFFFRDMLKNIVWSIFFAGAAHQQNIDDDEWVDDDDDGTENE